MSRSKSQRLVPGENENGIAVFAVLRREEFQKKGKQTLQNNRRLPCATCTYEHTCALLPFVHGHLSDLFVNCDIEHMSEPFANGPRPVSQLEAPSIWIGIIHKKLQILDSLQQDVQMAIWHVAIVLVDSSVQCQPDGFLLLPHSVPHMPVRHQWM